MLRMTLVLKVVEKIDCEQKVINFSYTHYFVWRQSTEARLRHILVDCTILYAYFLYECFSPHRPYILILPIVQAFF